MRSMGWLGLGVILVALLWLVAPSGCHVDPPSDSQTTSSTDTGNDISGDASADGGGDGPADSNGDSSGDAGQSEGWGDITGTIVDALTGNPLSGVQVALTDADHSAWTDDNGQFSLLDVPAGAHTLLFTLADYIDGESTLAVVADETVDMAGGLVKESQAGQEAITIVLTWGTATTQPKDLDLHLSGPDGAGARFHVYFISMSAGEHVSLDLDDTSWGGPETITIRRVSGGDFVAGEYHVWVHNYSTTPEFTGSGAVVTLFANGAQLGQYSVADASGDPALDIWQVVNITVDAAGNVTGANVQQVFAEGTYTVVF
jgi:hypothetical protein